MLSKWSKLFVRRPQGARRPSTARAGKPRRFRPQLEMLETRLTPSTVRFGAVTEALDINNESVELRVNSNGSTTIFINGQNRGTDTSHSIFLTASGGTNQLFVNDSAGFAPGFTEARISTSQFGQQQVTVGVAPPLFGNLYTLNNNLFALKALSLPTGLTDNVTITNNTNSLAGLGGWRVDGGGRATTVNLIDRGSRSDTDYQITGPQGQTQVSLANTLFGNYTGAGALNLRTGDGRNNVRVDSVASNTSIGVQGGAGRTFYDIGHGSLDAVAGPVNITGGANDEVAIDDSDATTRDNYVIRGGDVFFRNHSGLTYNHVQRLIVSGSSGANFDVVSTSAPTFLNPGAAGSSIRISNGGALDGIGSVSVLDAFGASTLTVDDSRFSGNDSYQITDFAITLGRSSGFRVAYLGIANLNFFGGSGSDRFRIDATSVNTTVNGGTGGNVFSLASATRSLASLAGPLQVNGGGADALVFFDTANPNAETYTFDAVPSQLTLTTVPVSVRFGGMASVFLETNGLGTVNDPSGTVLVDVPPPA
jgi:hypothetical protein